MKKRIIICAFTALILVTAIMFLGLAEASYQYDMENQVDILEGFGAFLMIVVGAGVVFYELDLFYTVYYFLTKPRTKAKSLLNILSNLSFLLIFVYGFLSHFFMELRVFETVQLILFLLYIALRTTYAFRFFLKTNL